VRKKEEEISNIEILNEQQQQQRQQRKKRVYNFRFSPKQT